MLEYEVDILVVLSC